MAGEKKPQNEPKCDMALFRANAIFIRAVAHCPKNFMDSAAGYRGLAGARQCASHGAAEIKSSAMAAMEELERVVRERGKAAGSRWVDEIERQVMGDAAPL